MLNELLHYGSLLVLCGVVAFVAPIVVRDMADTIRESRAVRELERRERVCYLKTLAALNAEHEREKRLECDIIAFLCPDEAMLRRAETRELTLTSGEKVEAFG